MTAEPAFFKELVYDPNSDVLQLWAVAGPLPPSLNVDMEDGLFRVVDVDDENRLLGYEIVNFRYYVSLHPAWRPLLETFERLPGRSLTLQEPSPGAGLRELLHA